MRAIWTDASALEALRRLINRLKKECSMKLNGRLSLLMLAGAMIIGSMLCPASTASAQATTQAVTATAPPAPVESNWSDFVASTKRPTPWFFWGADLRLRDEYYNNATTFNKDITNHEAHYQRIRTRLWTTITPLPDLDLNARLVYEPRHYCQPDSSDSWRNNEALFDILNVTWRNAFGLPLKFVVGRQDIVLGDGWHVAEGTPEDGSRTTFFDAVRATYELSEAKTTIDAIYIDQSATSDRWFDPFCNKRVPLIGQDERGGILYVTNKSLEKTQIDGYFIYKHDMRAPARRRGTAVGYNGNTYTYGGRVVHKFSDNWQLDSQIAQQLGDRNGNTVCAWGTNNKLTYFLRDQYDNQFRVGYEYLSGDDPNTSTDESMRLPWGRWARLGDLSVYMWVPETRVGDFTNMHRVQAGWSIKPNSVLEFSLDYNALFADENTLQGTGTGFSSNGPFRGHLGTAVLKYKFNQHVAGHLTGEIFCPGNYYTRFRNDPAFFLRYELTFTW
jgi:hypothetical protein